MSNQSRHDMYLERLVANLYNILEDIRDINWIMKDGIWLREDSASRNKLSDLILVYPKHGIPVELKGSERKRDKALEQIRSGKEFINQQLNLDCPYGKIVYYNGGRYLTQTEQW